MFSKISKIDFWKFSGSSLCIWWTEFSKKAKQFFKRFYFLKIVACDFIFQYTPYIYRKNKLIAYVNKAYFKNTITSIWISWLCSGYVLISLTRINHSTQRRRVAEKSRIASSLRFSLLLFFLCVSAANGLVFIIHHIKQPSTFKLNRAINYIYSQFYYKN